MTNYSFPFSAVISLSLAALVMGKNRERETDTEKLNKEIINSNRKIGFYLLNRGARPASTLKKVDECFLVFFFYNNILFYMNF